LRGKQINDETLEAVDGLVAKETQLMMSSIDSLSYKRKLMGLLVKGALTELMGGR
jgi:CO/xanthine dehydrogenase FAD-binding subunit